MEFYKLIGSSSHQPFQKPIRMDITRKKMSTMQFVPLNDKNSNSDNINRIAINKREKRWNNNNNNQISYVIHKQQNAQFKYECHEQQANNNINKRTKSRNVSNNRNKQKLMYLYK